MRVLYLTNLPAPYKVHFFEILGNSYVDLTVLFERKIARNRDKKWSFGETHSFKEIFLRGLRIGDEDGFCPSVLRYLKRKSYDAIVINGYTTPTDIIAILFLKIRKISYYLAIDGVLLKKENRIKNWLKRLLIPGARGYFSPSSICDDYLAGFGVQRNQCFRYPFTSLCVNDIAEYQNLPEDKGLYRKQIKTTAPYVILAVGQFIQRKGFDILIEASRYMRQDLEIYIIGSSIIPNEYLRIIEKNGIENVRFVPFLSKEEIAAYYKAADIFVLPTREDIWGLVVNEALAYGLPVITTKACGAGNEMIIDGKNGYLLKENSPEEIGKYVNLLLADTQLLSQMSINAMKSVNDYTLENMACTFASVLLQN